MKGEESHTPEGLLDDLKGERRTLVELIWKNVSQLPGDENQKAIRQAFIAERYTGELKAWTRRRDLYRNIFAAVTLGTAALGVISSGLAAATVHSRSLATTVILILIGVFVAIFAATNQFLSPREVAAEYKRDEFALRILGWRYLQQLERGRIQRQCSARSNKP